MQEEDLAGERSGYDGIERAERTDGRTGDEPTVELRRDDAERLPQFRHIPAFTAEEADRGWPLRSVQRICIAREQLDQGRLAGTVRPDDRAVLAGV